MEHEMNIKHERLRFKAKERTLPTKDKSCKVPLLSVAHVEVLGDVLSQNTYVKRDLGFPGQIDDFVLLSYGDTMHKDANYSSTWRGMTSDSVALATHDPLVVVDPLLNEKGHPLQFCPLMPEIGENNSEWALGITNVVQTYRGRGILFFLLNHRPKGKNNIIGAGVASVSMTLDSAYPVPSVHREAPWWWDANCEPWWGDVGAIGWGEHIYAYGHGKDSPFVYVCRVPWHRATDVSNYEYWNGDHWQKERLRNPGEKERVFWQINQGLVVYSNFYECFLFVYSGSYQLNEADNWMNSRVLGCTARAPEGPWSEPSLLYQATPITAGKSAYAATPHTHFDDTGKTLVITFTNHPNTIQAIKVTFEKVPGEPRML